MAMAVAMARPTGIRAAHTQLYEVLKVDKAATPAQLKSAYRNLAKDYHPDVSSHPDAQARFVELSSAYEVPYLKRSFLHFHFLSRILARNVE